MCLIIEDFTRAIYSLMMISILLAVYRMIQNSDKKEISFMKRKMAHIKTITIVTISISVIPGLFKVIATSLIFGNVNVHLSQANLLILFFGIIFRIISQIYKYKDEAQVEKKGENMM
jgi:H+/gluconate symporter-like permease